MSAATECADRLRKVAEFLDANENLPAPDVHVSGVAWHLTSHREWRALLRQITVRLGCRWVVSELGTCHSLRTTTGSRLGDVTVFVPYSEQAPMPEAVDLAEFKAANR